MHPILHVCLAVFRNLSVAAQVTITSLRFVAAQSSKIIKPIKLTAIVGISVFASNRMLADDIQPLGDEFGNAATFNRYQEHGALEGWGANHVELANINTRTPGHFRIVPRTTGWYEHLRGTHFSKNITGDFIVTAHLFVYSRRNPSGPAFPSIQLYSLGGILIREPRAITHAAPVPYTTGAVWPPQNFGSDWTPGDENWANTTEAGKGENYIFLSIGTAGNSGTRQFEIKDTRRSRSELYYSSNGINGSNEAWLQIIRVGNTVVCLRKHSAAGPWIVENRYPNADHAFPQFGSTLQVGFTAYTDFNSIVAYEAGGPQTQFNANYINIPGQPDLILDVDYMRIQRPDPALTEAVLQGMAVSYNPATNQTANPPVLLSASPIASPLVGDNANVPLGLVAPAQTSYSAGEGGNIEVTVIRSGASLDRALSMTYQTAAGTAGSGDFTPVSGTLNWAANDPVSKTILIPITNDGLAEGSENFSLTFSSLSGPATFPASDPQQTVNLTILDHPFDQWRFDHFGAMANMTEALANADFDSDGHNNLLEYALGSDPDDSAEVARPVFQREGNTISYTYPRLRGNIQYLVQYSTDLNEWFSAGIDQDVVTPLGENATATMTVLPDTERIFLRLRVMEL